MQFYHAKTAGMTMLDQIDLKILRALQANGRLSNQDLADQVALSPSACLRRVKTLEQDGLY
jgi:Lrp/AsnC family leucine-responsive transcriptional regulator